MALTVKKLVNRHGALVSAVTGALVGAAILVMGLLRTLVQALTTLGLGAGFDLGGAVAASLANTLALATPFALGFFLSLWILAPIAEELRLPHVVTRAVLATGVASTVFFVVWTVVMLVRTFMAEFPVTPGLFDVRLPDPPAVILSALADALTTFIASLPLGILAGVLLWLWRKDHPPRRPLSGLIDEV